MRHHHLHRLLAQYKRCPLLHSLHHFHQLCLLLEIHQHRHRQRLVKWQMQCNLSKMNSYI